MPENSLKITRNIRGGVFRLIRIALACVLLYCGVHLLASLVARSHPQFDPTISPLSAGYYGILAGGAILLAAYWLRGTIVRVCGILMIIAMVPFVIIGHLLTLIGAPEAVRRMPMAYLLVGSTLVYTGQGEWTLIPFAIRQIRERFKTA
ncbi:MAG TPA: hypothetical protein VGK19_15495 [Capsulimonadaceae bacterium]